MPNAPLRPCAQPHCPELVASGKCAAHQVQYERDRGTSTQRGYGVGWRRFRIAYIRDVVAQDPACRDCHKPFMSISEIELHHIKKAADRPDLLFEEQNILAICHSCHSARTIRGE